MVDLEEIREAITEQDKELIEVLAGRIGLTREVSKYKQTHDMPARDSDRWRELTEEHRHFSEDHGIDYDSLIKPIFDIIHAYVLKNVHEKLR